MPRKVRPAPLIGAIFGGPWVDFMELRTPASVEQKSATNDVDDQGGVLTNKEWQTLFSEVWLRDNARSMNTLNADGTLVTVNRHDVTCRWFPGLEEGMRFNVNNGNGQEYWYIITVIDLNGLHEWYNVTCTENEV